MKLLRSIWAIWAFLVTAVHLLIYVPICFIFMALFGKRVQRFLLGFGYKVVARTMYFLLGIRVIRHGAKGLDRNRVYVLVSNHRSNLDALANQLSTPVVFKFLGKAELGKIPVFGWLVRNLCILIDRGSRESRKAGFDKLNAEIKDGISILIYPEGTRNKTELPLNDFFKGAFRLAIEHQIPILPVVLSDTAKFNRWDRKLDLSPGIIHCHYLNPIETEGMDLEDVETLMKNVKNDMLVHIEQTFPKN